jgi:hypothetical protein
MFDTSPHVGAITHTEVRVLMAKAVTSAAHVFRDGYVFYLWLPPNDFNLCAVL